MSLSSLFLLVKRKVRQCLIRIVNTVAINLNDDDPGFFFIQGLCCRANTNKNKSQRKIS